MGASYIPELSAYIINYFITLALSGLSDNENKISNFHLPSIASWASFMESIVFGQAPLDNISFQFYITSYLDSAFRMGSAIDWIVNVINFAHNIYKRH